MTVYTPPSSVGPGPIVDLNDGDDLTVNAGVTLRATDFQTVNGLGGGHEINVYGHIVSDFDVAILNSVFPAGISSSIYIAPNASVESLNYEWAIMLTGNASKIQNDGTVIGSIQIDGDSKTTYSQVNNKGVIQGYIDRHETGDEQIVFRNYGSCGDGSVSYLANNNNAVDSIVNAGKLSGNVILGGGNDKYDGRSGQITGDISGEEGNDTIYGGSKSEWISGGDGNDILLGGKGVDTFYFGSVLNGSTNVDRILDFNAKDDKFELENAFFPKLAKVTGALPAKLFKDIGTGAKLDVDDRIVYNSKTGDLFYDADGSGASKAIKFAHLDNHAVLTHLDFFLV